MIKLFKNILNLSLTGKIALIHSFLISFFYILRKNNLGFDERSYILASFFKDNEQIDIDEYSYAPIFIIKFLKILIYGLRQFDNFDLNSYRTTESMIIFRFILILLILVISYLIFKISYKLQIFNRNHNLEYSIFSVSLILSIPCIFGKHLFALISLLSIPITLFIYYLLIPRDNNHNLKNTSGISYFNLFISGSLLSIINLFRYESISLFLFILLQYLFIIIITRKKEHIYKLVTFASGYILIFIPQFFIYALNYQLSEPPPIFLTTPYNGSGWVDGPSKYLQECYWQSNESYSIINCILGKEKLIPIVSSFAMNIKELSQAVFSIDSFPLYLSFLPCGGFLLMMKEKKFIDLFIFSNALVLSFLAYSLFEIEIRYALYATVGLSLYSVFVINNIKKFEIIKPVIKPLLLILFVNSYFYLLFSHSIY